MRSIICAIIKNEQRFIREWVEHYLKLGFECLYLYEDYGSESHAEILKDYIKQYKVVITRLDESDIIEKSTAGTANQYNLYKNFLEKCKREKLADWIGFFDVDEFMMFNNGWNLKRLENLFQDAGGVLLCWRIYGANGHLKRPEGKVVDNYTSYMPNNFKIDNFLKWNVKSLVNVENCTGLENIHVFKDCVFTDGKNHFDTDDMSFKKAWINHYFTKSWEDYCDRTFSRGNMNNDYRTLDLFFKCSPEFKDRENDMIESQRYRHTASTMYISKKKHIISGGNVDRLQELTYKLNKGLL